MMGPGGLSDGSFPFSCLERHHLKQKVDSLQTMCNETFIGNAADLPDGTVGFFSRHLDIDIRMLPDLRPLLPLVLCCMPTMNGSWVEHVMSPHATPSWITPLCIDDGTFGQRNWGSKRS